MKRKKPSAPKEPPPNAERPDESEPILPGVNPAAGSADADPGASAPFPVVGVGASAGGIEAFTQFFHALPDDTGMAFVVVQHLDPSHQSLLSAILGRATGMQVSEIENNAPVAPNRVYVIPPGKTLVIASGLLQLAPRTEVRGQHRPIDTFLRSLAEEMGYKAIGVILSGTASDGTLGLEEVKAAGGITFAQDDSAEQTSMPRSAVAAGVVDFVLPPDEIARELGRIGRHPYVQPLIVPPEKTRSDPEVLRVIDLLRSATGVDFEHYKYNTLHRRIMRRIVLHKLDGFADYVRFLQTHPSEVDALYQDVLINVTSFFRNEDAYEALKREVFPRLSGARGRHEPMRVWALGCSTGEEAYSIAIAYTEYTEAAGKHVPMQIFATDLNGLGIEKARAGLYPKGITQDVSPERLRRFFIEVDGSYRVCKPIRDMCVFARQNVLSDPPFSRMDLIACRNMLIYLEPVLQQRLIPILHYSLHNDGILWLGSSETIGSYRDLFQLTDPKHKIYSKKARAAAGAAERKPRSPVTLMPPAGREVPSRIADPQREADRAILAQYAPPAVVVSGELEILQFRGDTSPYLAPAPGRASLNLLKMLREGLLASVRGAIQRAQHDEIPVREDGLQVRSNGGWREVNVVVMPIKGGATPAGSLVVVFEESSPSADARTRVLRAELKVAESRTKTKEREGGGVEIDRLKHELAATRDYLQSVIEQQEASNQDLQSANEEVQSANEELQSINEEIETSKEEIESTNEELSTVNDELQNRNLELAQSNDDLTNLLASVQLPILMLGPDLCIRRFTPAAEKVMNVIPADIGRPIGDLKLTFAVPGLEQMVVAAMDSVSTQELEFQDKGGRWYSLRVRPYRTAENKIDGAVIVLVDVDKLKRAEASARDSEARFEVLANSAPVLMWVNGVEGARFVNRAYLDFLGVPEADVRNFEWSQFVHPDDRDAYLAAYANAVAARAPFQAQFRFRRADGIYRWMNSVASARFDGESFVGYVGCTYDITDMKEAEGILVDVDRGKDEFLAMLAHELRNPLAALLNAAQIMAASKDAEAVGFAQTIADRQTRVMMRLVDDLLDVSRISHGKLSLRMEDLDLNEVLRAAVAASEHERRATLQELTITQPRSRISVRGDSARLEQVFHNLLANAAKFTPRQGHITVALDRNVAGGRATVSIRDDGEGIPASQLEHIFDLFAQGSSADDGRRGLGIGLTLAKRLVEMHGGAIVARSEGAGKGSEFIVTLPLAAEVGPTARRSAKPSAAPPPTKRRVLIVDDNVDAAESQGYLLSVVGHAVRVAHGGAAALELAAEFHPEVVLLDIAMPGMDGYEVVKRLREDGINTDAFVIALTGFGRGADLDQARAAGFDGHLTKPVEIDRLLDLVARRRAALPDGGWAH